MPADAPWRTAMGLDFLPPVFDDIPLAALALEQGGHDADTVGCCGSMSWFG